MDFSENTLSISRVFHYPADTIFSKYSNADALARWWGPHGFINIFDSFDFREGGKWIFNMKDSLNTYYNEMLFQKIETNRIIMDHTVDPHFSLEIILEELGNNETKMIWNSTFMSIEFLNTMRDFLIEKNGENFDRLETELKNF